MSEPKKEGTLREQNAEGRLNSLRPAPRAACLLQSTTPALAAIDSPRLTAEALLAHLLGITRTQLLAHPEQLVSTEVLAQYRPLIARAAQGEPLAYLTGRREFYGLDFRVDARVLVPRPETERLVELALKFAAASAENAGRRIEILDVGTGSGCIAVALAVHCPNAHITAVDISAGVLALARRNAEHHRVADRITFLQSDLLSSVVRRPSSVNLLCANLPYIASDELRDLPVAWHEPALALDGGPDGLSLIRRLLADAPRVMAPHGGLLLEIGATQGKRAIALARKEFPETQVTLHQDLAGLDRVVAIRL